MDCLAGVAHLHPGAVVAARRVADSLQAAVRQRHAVLTRHVALTVPLPLLAELGLVVGVQHAVREMEGVPLFMIVGLLVVLMVVIIMVTRVSVVLEVLLLMTRFRRADIRRILWRVSQEVLPTRGEKRLHGGGRDETDQQEQHGGGAVRVLGGGLVRPVLYPATRS